MTLEPWSIEVGPEKLVLVPDDWAGSLAPRLEFIKAKLGSIEARLKTLVLVLETLVLVPRFAMPRL